MDHLKQWIARNKPVLHGTAVLVGTMVGVGVFSMPFVFMKAGLKVALLFLAGIAGVTVLTNLMYAEITLRTQGRHQLVGYTGLYLGPVFRRIILFSSVLGIWGALLAYILVSGQFLHNILSNFFFFSRSTYSIWFFIAASTLVLIGLRTVAWIEFGMTALFAVIILMIFGFGAGHVDMANLTAGMAEYWFLPYGVILFAFGGLTAIPIQREILRGREKDLWKVILAAIVLVGILYFLFAFTVAGVAGVATSEDALTGLDSFLGGRIVLLGSFFGVLALMTSFLMLGTALSDIYRLDYGMKRFPAWLLVVFPPLSLFLGGLRTFIDVIGLVGAVAMGIDAIILIFVFLKAKKSGERAPELNIRVPKFALFGLAAVFLTGVLYELFKRISL